LQQPTSNVTDSAAAIQIDTFRFMCLSPFHHARFY